MFRRDDELGKAHDRDHPGIGVFTYFVLGAGVLHYPGQAEGDDDETDERLQHGSDWEVHAPPPAGRGAADSASAVLPASSQASSFGH